MLKRFRSRFLLGILITGLFLMMNQGWTHVDLIERLELIAYDVRLASTTEPGAVDPRVVIIDIDERSLKEEGHWPWNRVKLAQLVHKLIHVYEMDIIGFDIVFAERDSSEEIELLEQVAAQTQDQEFQEKLRQLTPLINPDAVFADTMRDQRVVLGYYFDKSIVRSTQVGSLGDPVFGPGSGYYDMLQLPKKQVGDQFVEAEVTSFTGNIPELEEAALASGFYSINSVDRDGILRRIQLMEKYNGGIYEALSLALARLYIGGELELQTSLNEQGREIVHGLDIGTGTVPVDNRGSSYIPYKGRAFSFRYVSATDVLNEAVENAEDLQFAIGLVGTTAAGLVDLRNSPLQQNNYPGVEVHASTIVGLLDADFRSRPYYSAAAEFVTLLIVGVVLSLVLPPLGALGATLLAAVTAGLLVAGNMYLWTAESTILSIAPTLLLVLCLYVLNVAYGYLFESRNKARLSGLFGQYIPPELVEEMAKDPEDYTLEAKRQQLSVLFTDVRGFTNISEGLDPKTLSELMNELLSPMTRIVHETQGTIDKYMGDAMMAFWGAPIDDPDHANKALKAGLLMLRELDSINAAFEKRGWPEVRIGVGVNTGEMNVGNMGSEFRMAYTVLGDAVNLGSRVEGLTKNYGVDFIATEFTVACTPDYVFRRLDSVRVKGKDKPVTIFEPVCEKTDLDKQTENELNEYEAALNFHLEQRFTDAIEAFEALASNYGERAIYDLYIERSKHFIQEPPGPDWDGVFTFTTK